MCMQRLLPQMRYRDDKSYFLVRRYLNTQKPDDFWFAPCDDAIWKGNRVWIHSSERKLSALSNAVSGKVVRRIGRELLDLKARGDIFLITLYITDRADEIIWKRGLQNWRRSECFALGPPSILQAEFPNNFVRLRSRPYNTAEVSKMFPRMFPTCRDARCGVWRHSVFDAV